MFASIVLREVLCLYLRCGEVVRYFTSKIDYTSSTWRVSCVTTFATFLMGCGCGRAVRQKKASLA